jgi:hypothetical protein
VLTGTLSSSKTTIVDEVTTLRRHVEARHLARYRTWATSAGFESKLPGDVKRRKEAETVTRTLDRDLVEKKTTERIVPYSDKLFRKAAIDWLVATDQVGFTRHDCIP